MITDNDELANKINVEAAALVRKLVDVTHDTLRDQGELLLTSFNDHVGEHAERFGNHSLLFTHVAVVQFISHIANTLVAATISSVLEQAGEQWSKDDALQLVGELAKGALRGQVEMVKGVFTEYDQHGATFCGDKTEH